MAKDAEDRHLKQLSIDIYQVSFSGTSAEHIGFHFAAAVRQML